MPDLRESLESVAFVANFQPQQTTGITIPSVVERTERRQNGLNTPTHAFDHWNESYLGVSSAI